MSGRRLPVVGGIAATLVATLLVALGTLGAPTAALLSEREIMAAPVVIGHRGASGYRPEHTLAAYLLAIRMGADYIEPDLVVTRDGVLVARHENEIGATTDVARHPEFAARRTTKTVDGRTVTGWFTEDFTLAELRTLRARERMPASRPRNTVYDGRYLVPTLQEIIDLAREEGRWIGRRIGIYLETKHPTYFGSIGRPLEEPLVATLERNNLDHRGAKVIVQSFEAGNLRALRGALDVPMVQLISGVGAPYDLVSAGDPRTYDDLATPAGLRGIASYADGVGVAKERIFPVDHEGRRQPPTSIVADAHRAGLFVHAWTFHADNPSGEYRAFLGQGVDGVFSDNPDVAVEAVRRSGRRVM
ncbi:MAG TPA: glycerophosphodiester phosphodiesterase [Cryptosporangiaceae bacterium]|nr:glycerophosphodiester phosphodiesterase [Cryptosporangiaceae bacterium]